MRLQHRTLYIVRSQIDDLTLLLFGMFKSNTHAIINRLRCRSTNKWHGNTFVRTANRRRYNKGYLYTSFFSSFFQPFSRTLNFFISSMIYSRVCPNLIVNLINTSVRIHNWFWSTHRNSSNWTRNTKSGRKFVIPKRLHIGYRIEMHLASIGQTTEMFTDDWWCNPRSSAQFDFRLSYVWRLQC